MLGHVPVRGWVEGYSGVLWMISFSPQPGVCGNTPPGFSSGTDVIGQEVKHEY